MMALATVPFSRIPDFRVQSGGASETALRLKRLWATAASHARDHAADWRPMTKALIEEVAVKHDYPNWDGYGAKPIAPAAKEQAQWVIDLMPSYFPAPDPVPDPDGDIALSWDFGPGHIFTLSIDSAGILTYAGLFGSGSKRHGVEPFKGCIPKIVFDSIEELCDRAGAFP